MAEILLGLKFDSKTGEASIKKFTSSQRSALSELEKRGNSAFNKIDNAGSSAFTKLGAGLNNLKANWLAVTGVILATKGAFDLAESAARFDRQSQSFTNLVASYGANAQELTASLKDVANGAISTAGVMTSAGKAILLGIPVEQLTEMMAVARASSTITGQTIEQAFSDISVGMGRQSKLILDNLGIVFKMEDAYEDYAISLDKTTSELSEAEKKQAFMNATLKAGQNIIARVGEQGLSAAEAIDIFKAKISDAGIIAGKVLVSISAFATGIVQTIAGDINNIIALTLSAMATVFDIASKMPFVGKTFEGVASTVRSFADASEDATKMNRKSAKSAFEMGTALWKAKVPIDGITRSTQEQVEANKALIEEMAKLEDQIKKLEDQYLQATTGQREFLVIQAQEMQARGVDIELINDWLSVHEKIISQKEKEKEQELELQEINRLKKTEVQPILGGALDSGLSEILNMQNNLILMEELLLKKEEMIATSNLNITELEIQSQQIRTDIELQQNAMRLQSAQSTLGFMGNLMNSFQGFAIGKSKAFFLIQKGVAVAQAVIAANQASAMALAMPPGPPATIPMAGIALKMGLANAAVIAATAIGGGRGGGGGGGGGAVPSISTSAPSTTFQGGALADNVPPMVGEGKQIKFIVNMNGLVMDAGNLKEALRDVVMPAMEELGDTGQVSINGTFINANN